MVEQIDQIKTYRSYIYATTSKGIVSRLLNYFSFVFSSLFFGVFTLGKYDVILCESPPLFLGISGRILAFFKRSSFIFNVSDLWPESAEKLGIVTNKTVLNLATILEEWLYRKSAMVTGQTQGIVRNIQERFPNKKVYWLPNGVDLDYFNPEQVQSNWRLDNGFNESDILFLYAGIIGYAQGLEVILKAANLVKSHDRLKFILLGSGPEKERLIQMQEELGLSNVHFFDGVTKKEMPYIIKDVDVALIPLKKLPLFEGAIPSKIFENLAMGKPILLGVEGEAHQLFIDEGACGLGFEPENFEDLAEKCLSIKENPDQLNNFALNARNYVSKKFNRNDIAVRFHDQLKAFAK